MTETECIAKSREDRQIPDDKFDRHMKKARETDKDSRKKMFVCQTESTEERNNRIRGIMPSVY